MKNWIFMTMVFVSTFIALAALPAKAHARDAKIYTSWRNNLAAGGYDAVSFHSGNPSRGSAKISTVWSGVKWQFSTQANKEVFLGAPEKYAPAYGGYCAWAIANRKLAKGSPKHWTVKDGRLYLNFNKKIKTRWLVGADEFITKGDENWPGILEQ